MKKVPLFIAILSLLLTVNVSAQKNAENIKPTAVTDVPKVTQIDEIKIKELLKPDGKPLLVNFWATWCVPCQEEFPDLVEIDEEFRGKIDFITITLDDLAEIDRDVPKFLSEMKATMPTYLLKTTDENGVIGSVSKEWQGGLPFTVLYDEKGEVAHARQGKIKPAVVREKIGKLLRKGNQIIEKLITQLPETGFYHKSRYNYERGMADAKKDLAEGKYIIKRYGLTPGVAQKPGKQINKVVIQEYGCMVNENLIEYVRGYNEISRAAIKEKFGESF